LDFETAETTAAVFSPSPILPPPTTTGAHPDDDEPSYLSHSTLELSTPFLKDTHTSRAQATALPYHWLELGHLLLTHASDDIEEADAVRRLLRDLREVRMSKLRKGFRVLEGGAGLQINGVGGMEVAEVRGFVGGVVDGLRWVFLLVVVAFAMFMLEICFLEGYDADFTFEQENRPFERRG
jgi:GINS complex subunit 2